jgi:hypothetical protein
VLSDAFWWEEPIRLYHPKSGKHHILRNGERAALFRQDMDTAALMFNRGEFPLPIKALNLVPEGNYLKVGSSIGWLGFPGVSPQDLCFFSGCVSAWIDPQRSYLVDGVAINGVSGGPTFAIIGSDFMLIGVVSAYMPNRATGEALPGLSIVRDVAQYQELAKEFENLEAALKQQEVPLPKAQDRDSCWTGR